MSAPLFTREFTRLLNVNMAFHLGFSTFYMLPKFMAAELRARPSEIGSVTTVFGLAMIAAVPLTGRALDRFGTRWVLLLGAALSACASLGFLWVEQVGTALYVLRATHGLALSMFVSAGSILSAEQAPVGRLGQAIGIFAGSGMIMGAFGPPLTEWLAERAGYAPAFALASAAGLLALLLARDVAESDASRARRSSLRALLVRNTSLRMLGVLGASGLGFGAMFAFSGPFSLELGMANVRGFFLAFTIAALFVRVCLGSMIDRVGHRRTATYALYGYGAAVALMYLLTPDRLALFGAFFGFSHGLFIPAFTAFVVSEVELHERSKMMTLFHGAFNLGNSMAFALGIAVEHYGYRAVFAATGALMLTAPMLLVGWPETTSA